MTGRVFPPPGAGATVVIGGKSATPDPATGAFQIDDVTTPYDLVAIAGQTGVLYQGLTRKDPVIVTATSTPKGPRSGTISGAVNWAPTIPSDSSTRVAFGAPEVADNTTTTGTYSLTPHWSGASSITGTLHALQWQTTSASDLRPASFSGYVEVADVVLADGGTTARDLTLGPTGTGHATGTVSAPAGYTVSMTFGRLVFADKSWVSLFNYAAPAGPFDYLVPAVAGASVKLKVSGSDADGDGAVSRTRPVADASGVELSIPRGPVRSAPADGATGVTTGTPFTWSPFASGVHVVGFGSSTPGLPKFAVVTAGSSATIPDLSALGLALPKGASYSWRVQAYGPFASLDEAADGSAIQNGNIVAPGEVTYEGETKAATFTTAP